MHIELFDEDDLDLDGIKKLIEDVSIPKIQEIIGGLESRITDTEEFEEEEGTNSWAGTTDQEHAEEIVIFLQDAVDYLENGVRAIQDARGL